MGTTSSRDDVQGKDPALFLELLKAAFRDSRRFALFSATLDFVVALLAGLLTTQSTFVSWSRTTQNVLALVLVVVAALHVFITTIVKAVYWQTANTIEKRARQVAVREMLRTLEHRLDEQIIQERQEKRRQQLRQQEEKRRQESEQQQQQQRMEQQKEALEQKEQEELEQQQQSPSAAAAAAAAEVAETSSAAPESQKQSPFHGFDDTPTTAMLHRKYIDNAVSHVVEDMEYRNPPLPHGWWWRLG